MELKNCKIGILLDDDRLGYALAELLMQQGAYVYRAKNEDEMERLRRGLDLDLVVVCERAKRGLVVEAFGVN